jgi:hypothetical protein
MRLLDIVIEALSIVEGYTDDVNPSMSIIGEQRIDDEGEDGSEGSEDTTMTDVCLE